MIPYKGVVVGSQTTSQALPVDRSEQVNQVGVAVVVSAGATLTYSVEYTYDDVQNSAVTPTWIPLSTMTAKSATADGTISSPVRAVRLNVTAFTSGTATITVMQGGKSG